MKREMHHRAYIKAEKKMVDLMGFVYEGETGIRIWFNDGSGGILNQSFGLNQIEIMEELGYGLYEEDVVVVSGSNPDIPRVIKYLDCGFRLSPDYEPKALIDLLVGGRLQLIGNTFENPVYA